MKLRWIKDGASWVCVGYPFRITLIVDAWKLFYHGRFIGSFDFLDDAQRRAAALVRGKLA
jgi:hypothetical protein